MELATPDNVQPSGRSCCVKLQGSRFVKRSPATEDSGGLRDFAGGCQHPLSSPKNHPIGSPTAVAQRLENTAAHDVPIGTSTRRTQSLVTLCGSHPHASLIGLEQEPPTACRCALPNVGNNCRDREPRNPHVPGLAKTGRKLSPETKRYPLHDRNAGAVAAPVSLNMHSCVQDDSLSFSLKLWKLRRVQQHRGRRAPARFAACVCKKKKQVTSSAGEKRIGEARNFPSVPSISSPAAEPRCERSGSLTKHCNLRARTRPKRHTSLTPVARVRSNSERPTNPGSRNWRSNVSRDHGEAN